MNASGSRNKSKSMRSEDSLQAEGSVDIENRVEEENRQCPWRPSISEPNVEFGDEDTENETPENEGDNEMEQNDNLYGGDQSDSRLKKSASSEGSKRISPVQMDEREPKKAVAASVKPTRRYQGRASLMGRHRDLSQERKRLLNAPSTITRNSSLTPLLIKEGGSLTGLLNDIPDYYTDEVTVQFLNAQVRVLRDELQSVIQECVEKEEMVLLLEKRLKETEQERNKLLRDNSNKQQLIEKYQRISDDNRSRADKLESQCASLRKEVEILKQGQKQVVASKGTVEARLSRAIEEIEKYKSDLRLSKQTSKEASENDKRRIEELAADNRRLEKQRTELLTAFKKQMKLIDNLKRQKMHLEAAKALQFTEEEFMRALDWGS